MGASGSVGTEQYTKENIQSYILSTIASYPGFDHISDTAHMSKIDIIVNRMRNKHLRPITVEEFIAEYAYAAHEDANPISLWKSIQPWNRPDAVDDTETEELIMHPNTHLYAGALPSASADERLHACEEDDASFDAIRPSGWNDYNPNGQQSDSSAGATASSIGENAHRNTTAGSAASHEASLPLESHSFQQEIGHHRSPSTIAQAMLFATDQQRTRYRTAVDVKSSGATEWDNPQNKRSRV